MPTLTKGHKADLFKENQRYLHLILQEFLKRKPSFYYMYDDLYQEASLKFLHVLDRYDSTKGMKLSTFIHQQIRWYLLNAVAKEVRYSLAEQSYTEELEMPTSYDPYKFQEILRWATLTDYQKDIIRMRYLEDMTFEEISMEFGVSKQAISRSERRAVETLRRELI